MERERPTKSAVRRYYSDVKRATSHTEAVMALACYYETEIVTGVLGLDELAKSPLMPKDDDYDNGSLRAKDKLALLPLYAFGPSVERSAMNPAQVRDWYAEVINYIKLLTGEVHSEACYEFDNGTTQHCKCSQSDTCPWRYMEQYFGDPVIEVGIDDPFFDDQKRRHEMSLCRLGAGEKTNILLAQYAMSKRATYLVAYGIAHGDSQVER